MRLELVSIKIVRKITNMIQFKFFNITLFVLGMITILLNNLINIQAREILGSRQVRLIISLRNLQSGMNRLIGQKLGLRMFLTTERNKIFYSWNHLKLVMRH